MRLNILLIARSLTPTSLREAYKALFIRSPKTFYSHSQARSCTVRGPPGGVSEISPRHPQVNSRQASGSNLGENTADDPVINCDMMS